MAAVPVRVWTNAAMYVLAGGYLWWRLVGQTTGTGTAGQRVGTSVLPFVALG